MIAIGIDLSVSSTGFVVLESSDKGPPIVLEEAVIKPNSKLKGVSRYLDITRTIMQKIYSRNYDVIVLEGYSLNLRFASSVIPLVELGGILRFLFVTDKIKWVEVKATQLKKFVTGKGNAKKEQMLLQVFKRWGYETDSNDLADAYSLACMGLGYLMSLNGITKEQAWVTKEMQEVSF